MTTRNASRRTAATRGGGTSEQDGQEGKRTGDQAGSGRGGGRGGQESNHGSQGSSQGNGPNGGGGRVPDFATIIAQQNKSLPTIQLEWSVKEGILRREGIMEKSVGNESVSGLNNKRSRTGRAFATIPQTLLGRSTLDCRVGPKVVNPLNARNPIAARGACFECGVIAIEGGKGRGNNGNPARGRAFVMGVEEARQDTNIVTGTFTLNNDYATTLFDSGVDYSFVSTTFIPLLDIEPNNLGMDWLSKHKAEIVCHEKVVKIPPTNGKMLKVFGEMPEEKGLTSFPKIKFRIDLIPRAMLVAKSPYHLAPSEMELSSQLRELHDKGFIRPSSSRWGAPSNTVQALKVDSVVMENTCSGKDNSKSNTTLSKSVKESSLDSATKDVHAIKYKMSKEKKRCMAYFRSLHSHLQVLSKEDLKGTRIEHGFKQAFMSLFGQDVDTFTSTMLLNVDQLQKQLDKDEFQEDGSMAAFWVVNNQF
ncbi:hypothetical protein Tco_0405696 [Tanacetum coccineum]